MGVEAEQQFAIGHAVPVDEAVAQGCRHAPPVAADVHGKGIALHARFPQGGARRVEVVDSPTRTKHHPVASRGYIGRFAPFFLLQEGSGCSVDFRGIGVFPVSEGNSRLLVAVGLQRGIGLQGG